MWEETIKGTILDVLDGIDALCREHDQEIRQVRRDYERRLAGPARAGGAPVYGARVERLLAWPCPPIPKARPAPPSAKRGRCITRAQGPGPPNRRPGPGGHGGAVDSGGHPPPARLPAQGGHDLTDRILQRLRRPTGRQSPRHRRL
jgi:hypothetical protein